MNKTKNDGLYFFWSGSILLCVILAVFALMFTSCSKKGEDKVTPSESQQENTPQTGDEETGTPETDNLDENDPEVSAPNSDPDSTVVGLAETEDMGQEYIDKFVLLGDSTTHGMVAYGVLPASQIWTPASGTLTLAFWSEATIDYTDTNEEIPIEDCAAKKQPEYLLITLGVNGVSFMDETYFIDEYTKLINAILEASPDTKIIINSIYPVTSAYDPANGISNPKIEAANSWLQQISKDMDIPYLDSASVLKTEDGSLDNAYCNGDKLHLNAEGYNRVIDYIRTHGYK